MTILFAAWAHRPSQRLAFSFSLGYTTFTDSDESGHECLAVSIMSHRRRGAMLDRDHPFFPKFEALAAEAAASTPVYDLGTSARFAKEVGLVRQLFDESRYYACGYKPDNLGQPGGCDLDIDIQDMHTIADGVAGSVFCMEVLEHVQRPRDAVREIFRVLAPGGLAIVATPFLISYHGKSGPLRNPVVDTSQRISDDARHETYGDYWRYTHEGLALLFEEAGFSRVDIYPVDGRVISRLHQLNLYHHLKRIPGFVWLVNRLDRPLLGRATTLHLVRAEKAGSSVVRRAHP